MNTHCSYHLTIHTISEGKFIRRRLDERIDNECE